MPQLKIKLGKSYRMLLVVAILVAHKLETWLQDLLAVILEEGFQDKFSLSRACIIVLCMLNGSFQAHISYDLIWMYLWLTLGALSLYGGILKNIIGHLQFLQRLWLQAVEHFAYSLVSSIKWVTYDSWLSQPEGVKSVILEAYPEHWLVLSTLMVYTWQITEQCMQHCGAWKLVKVNFAVLTTNQKPPDPPLKPTSGEQYATKKKRHPKQHKGAHRTFVGAININGVHLADN